MFNKLALAIFVFTYPTDCCHVGVGLEDPIAIDDLEKSFYCIKSIQDEIEWNVEQALLIERFTYYLQEKISRSYGETNYEPLLPEMERSTFKQMHFKCKS